MDRANKTMTAIAITQPGGPEVLRPVQIPVPEPGPGEILVKVEAAGVNRPDCLQRLGLYSPPEGAPETPGLEVAGTVASIGEGVRRVSIGDTVTALVAGGGYAQFCVASQDLCLPVPDGFSMVEAAAIPETFFTVWHNVFERGALQSGETILIHGGSSGIGTTAIQLAHALGAKIAVTAGSDGKCQACLDLGADIAINYRDQDFVQALKEKTGGRGADVILDMVGGDYIGRNFEAAAEDGRIVQIAFLNGANAEADFSLLMRKRLTMTGSTLRPRPLSFKADLAGRLKEKVWPLLEDRTVAPLIHTTFDLARAADAHAAMEESNHIGKIVLTVAH